MPEFFKQKPNDSVDRQMEHRESWHVGGEANAKVIDVTSEHPEKVRPLDFVPPWGFSARGFKPVIKILSETGRRVLSIDPPSSGGEVELNKEQQSLMEGFPPELVRKAFIHTSIMDRKQTGPIGAIGHSEGAAIIGIAALLRPDIFRNIVMVDPPGFIGQDNVGRLVWTALVTDNIRKGAANAAAEGFPAIHPSDAVKKDGVFPPMEMAKHILPNPARTVRELNDVAQYDMPQILRLLKARNVGVVIMSAAFDPVFPQHQIQQTVLGQRGSQEKTKDQFLKDSPEYEAARNADIDSIAANIVDGVVITRGVHGSFGEHPELYVPAAEGLLRKLEEKEERRYNA